jgi:hypothetical protein
MTPSTSKGSPKCFAMEPIDALIIVPRGTGLADDHRPVGSRRHKRHAAFKWKGFLIRVADQDKEDRHGTR